MAKAEAKAEAKPDGPVNTWGERRIFHADDVLLRRHKFKIVARPPGRAAVWTRAGEVYSQQEAVAICELESEAAEGKN